MSTAHCDATLWSVTGKGWVNHIPHPDYPLAPLCGQFGQYQEVKPWHGGPPCEKCRKIAFPKEELEAEAYASLRARRMANSGS